MDLNELLQEKREAILQLATKHGARNVRVFGSVARHEANEQSDIDTSGHYGAYQSVVSSRLYSRPRRITWPESRRGDRKWGVLVAASPHSQGSQAIMTRDPRVYLAHILGCANRIEQYLGQDREAFLRNTMVQDAVIQNFEVIGEAAKRIPDSSGLYMLQFLGG